MDEEDAIRTDSMVKAYEEFNAAIGILHELAPPWAIFFRRLRRLIALSSGQHLDRGIQQFHFPTEPLFAQLTGRAFDAAGPGQIG